GTSVTLYGSLRPLPNFFVDGQLGFTSLDFDSRRYSADDGALVQGTRGGINLYGALTISTILSYGNFNLAPYATGAFINTTLSRYTETGSDFWALGYSGVTARHESVAAGVRGYYDVNLPW